jgi:hypothetical protein
VNCKDDVELGVYCELSESVGVGLLVDGEKRSWASRSMVASG